jgi:uncharacterized membrane protein YoaK (UPF0700 family)
MPTRLVTVMRPSLPVLLSFNGGYVDTAGFLALQGLFTAHVTGNFVTLGAALVFGTTGVLAKILALPVFCVAIIATRLASQGLAGRDSPALAKALTVKLILLIIGAALAIRLGPFTSGDGWPALITGMTFVSAMAIQNAAHRIHLSAVPPSTLMTGTTTQMMIDIADTIRGLSPEKREVTQLRLRSMGITVASFAAGAGLAAWLFSAIHMWCFVVPPLAALAARMVARRQAP